MSKRITTILVFMMVLALAVFIASTQAAAQDPLPLECTAGAYSISLVSKTNGLFEYEITATPAKMKKLTRGVMFQSLPDWEVNPVIDSLGDPANDPGEGDTSTKWGYGIFNGVTAAHTLQQVVGEKQRFKFQAKSETSNLVSIILVTGADSIVKCDSGIEGPGFLSYDPEPQVFTFTREADGTVCDITITLEPFGVEAEFVSGNSEKCTTKGPFDIEDLPIGSDTSRAIELQDGWFAFHGSPAEYCYYNKKKRKYVCVEY